MLDTLFRGVFDSGVTRVVTPQNFLLCLGGALAAGLLLALLCSVRNRYSGSFISTLALLPAVVCVVIMMVNGNVGTGVAVAGAFSLVRFRSAPGTAREIDGLFLAMAAGLMMGMGYIGYGLLFTVVMGLVHAAYSCLDLGGRRRRRERLLRVTIPEDLDYPGVFDDLLKKYTSAYSLQGVKTTNMGSLFRLTYAVTLRDEAQEKALLDELRCRNGNLEISMSPQESHTAAEL